MGLLERIYNYSKEFIQEAIPTPIVELLKLVLSYLIGIAMVLYTASFILYKLLKLPLYRVIFKGIEYIFRGIFAYLGGVYKFFSPILNPFVQLASILLTPFMLLSQGAITLASASIKYMPVIVPYTLALIGMSLLIAPVVIAIRDSFREKNLQGNTTLEVKPEIPEVSLCNSQGKSYDIAINNTLNQKLSRIEQDYYSFNYIYREKLQQIIMQIKQILEYDTQQLPPEHKLQYLVELNSDLEKIFSRAENYSYNYLLPYKRLTDTQTTSKNSALDNHALPGQSAAKKQIFN